MNNEIEKETEKRLRTEWKAEIRRKREKTKDRVVEGRDRKKARKEESEKRLRTK